MIRKPVYLVPFDFSEFSENALNFALELAKSNNGYVLLLNIVKDKSDKTKIRLKYRSLLDKISDTDRDLIETRVLVGNLYDDIGKASEILKPALIVMGTHGAKGMQKIFGSHVEKIISNSASPLLITRGDHSIENMKIMIMPFNFAKESIKITRFASLMAKKFNACIHLVGEHDNNDVHEEAIEKNQQVVERFLTENGVDFKIVNLPLEEDYESELFDYAGNVRADVIAAAYSNDSSITTNSQMQRLFENIYKIPVLTVNSEELK